MVTHTTTRPPKTAKTAKTARLLAFPGVSLSAGAPTTGAPDPVLRMLDTSAARLETSGDYLAAAAMRGAAARIAFLTWRLDKLQRKQQTGGRA